MGYRVINARGQHDPHAKAEKHHVDESGRLWLHDADGGFVAAYDMGRWESFGVTEKPAERITLTPGPGGSSNLPMGTGKSESRSFVIGSCYSCGDQHYHHVDEEFVKIEEPA